MSPETSWRSTAFAMRLTAFAGLAPLLSLGFVTSAVANRLVFAVWAVLTGLVYTLALRRAALAGVAPMGRLAVSLTVAAVALAFFGHLVARHHEALDLGLRATLPGLYRPWLTEPAAFYGTGAVLGVGALIAYFLRGKS